MSPALRPLSWFAVLATFSVLAVGLRAQEPEAPPPDASQQPAKPATPQEREQLMKLLHDAGIELDVEKQTFTIPARTNQPADLLEYLLISARGKAHEALLVTEVKPSLLNAAFLALGYDPQQGVNATWREKQPPPTEEQIAAGVEPMELLPPRGQQVWITVELPAVDGKPAQRVAIEDLIVDLTADALLRGNEWIYLGGRVAPVYRDQPPVFLADFEGNLVSICYLHPANHLVTMKHERARDDQNWWKNNELVPPPNTDVRLTFHRKKPDVVVAREKRLAEEDAAKPKAKGNEKGKETTEGGAAERGGDGKGGGR